MFLLACRILLAPVFVLLLHEACHALMALLLGVKLWGVTWGSGPVLASGRVLGLNYQRRRHPFFVGAAILDGQTFSDTRAMLIALGPLILGLPLLLTPIGQFVLGFNLINLLPIRGWDGWRVLHPSSR